MFNKKEYKKEWRTIKRTHYNRYKKEWARKWRLKMGMKPRKEHIPEPLVIKIEEKINKGKTYSEYLKEQRKFK